MIYLRRFDFCLRDLILLIVFFISVFQLKSQSNSKPMLDEIERLIQTEPAKAVSLIDSLSNVSENNHSDLQLAILRGKTYVALSDFPLARLSYYRAEELAI